MILLISGTFFNNLITKDQIKLIKEQKMFTCVGLFFIHIKNRLSESVIQIQKHEAVR